MASRTVLIVRGGWEGHHPVECTDSFVPFLQDHGFDVTVSESTAVYADAAIMGSVDLILQCVTMSEISADELAGLRDAIADGAGFAGWHGGIADSFRGSADYLQLVGGQFAAHPGKNPTLRDGGERDNFLRYTVEITDRGRRHEITAAFDSFELETEQYWVLHDDLIDVLATTTHPSAPSDAWHRPVHSPVVWTRHWADGRIFVATPGHSLEVLDDPNVRGIIENGLLWASRARRERPKRGIGAAMP